MVFRFVFAESDDTHGMKGGGGGLKEELRILKNVRIWLRIILIDDFSYL